MLKLLALLLFLSNFPTYSAEPIITDNSDRPLTEKERKILAQGEISTTHYIAGGLVGSWLGLGIGHSIQGRYLESGVKFTTGEVISATVMFIGFGQCVSDQWDSREDLDCSKNAGFTAGLIGFVGFRIWEIVDLWYGPIKHNRRYHDLINEQRRPMVYFHPITNQDRVGLGLSYSF